MAAPGAWAEKKYACKCKGIQTDWGLFSTYDYCGNGFAEGNKDDLGKDFTADGLDNYIQPGVSSVVKDGTGCGYYSQSGWNSGKLRGALPPSCVPDYHRGNRLPGIRPQ